MIGTLVDPLFGAGHHERGRRPGTEAVLLIHGFGLAAELAAAEREPNDAHVRQLRQRLVDGLTTLIYGACPGSENRMPACFGMRWISNDRIPNSPSTPGTQAGTMPRSSPHNNIGLARRITGSFS